MKGVARAVALGALLSASMRSLVGCEHTPTSPGGAAPWMVMDFSQYPNTAALLADVGDGSPFRWDASRASNQGQLVLDPTVTYGALPQSMR